MGVIGFRYGHRKEKFLINFAVHGASVSFSLICTNWNVYFFVNITFERDFIVLCWLLHHPFETNYFSDLSLKFMIEDMFQSSFCIFLFSCVVIFTGFEISIANNFVSFLSATDSDFFSYICLLTDTERCNSDSALTIKCEVKLASLLCIIKFSVKSGAWTRKLWHQLRNNHLYLFQAFTMWFIADIENYKTFAC